MIGVSMQPQDGCVCKSMTSGVLNSQLNQKQSQGESINSLWGFHLLFICRAQYCVRPTTTTSQDLETYHLEE
jgi:hypothetical protein